MKANTETHIRLRKIGDKVRIMGEKGSEVPENGVVQEICDIGYLDNYFTPTTAKKGRLMYFLKIYGWVSVEHCEIFVEDGEPNE